MATRNIVYRQKKILSPFPSQYTVYTAPPVSQNIRKYDHHDTFHVKYCFSIVFLKLLIAIEPLIFFPFFCKRYIFKKSGRVQTHNKCVRTHTLAHKAVGRARLCKALQLKPVSPRTPDLVKLVNHVTSKKRGEADCLTRKIKN